MACHTFSNSTKFLLDQKIKDVNFNFNSQSDTYTCYLPGINECLKPDIFRHFSYKQMNLLLNSIKIK